MSKRDLYFYGLHNFYFAADNELCRRWPFKGDNQEHYKVHTL